MSNWDNDLENKIILDKYKCILKCVSSINLLIIRKTSKNEFLKIKQTLIYYHLLMTLNNYFWFKLKVYHIFNIKLRFKNKNKIIQ